MGKMSRKRAAAQKNKLREVFMASDQSFVDYVCDQLAPAGEIIHKKMFGEYGLYCQDKIFALVCDNRLYFKPTEAGREFIGSPEMAPPYPGAREYFLIEEKLEDSEWLTALLRCSLPELPAPKPRRKRKP